MKEIFNKFNYIDLNSKNLILFDTCFFIDIIKKDKHSTIKNINFSMTSFNIEELIHVTHSIKHNLKHKVRDFFKEKQIDILNIDVSLGQIKKQRDFINNIDENLLKHIHDPSDAVLVASAIKTNSVILTKDKHHLFTSELENFISKYNIKIFKEVKDIIN
ncbi:MAG: PIN domain-containing protein [Candidatus Woesearchaeota archaeon]